MTLDLFQLRNQLDTNWNILHDVDRAAQIVKIRAAGMSIRTLARSLHKSESLIRHLRTVDDAYPEEKLLARAGKISTNKMVRLVENRRRLKAQRQEEFDSERRATETKRATKEILTWLQSRLSPPYAEQVIDETRRLLSVAAATNTLPKSRAPKTMTVTDIIKRCEPQPSPIDDTTPIARFAYWSPCGPTTLFPTPGFATAHLRARGEPSLNPKPYITIDTVT